MIDFDDLLICVILLVAAIIHGELTHSVPVRECREPSSILDHPYSRSGTE